MKMILIAFALLVSAGCQKAGSSSTTIDDWGPQPTEPRRVEFGLTVKNPTDSDVVVNAVRLIDGVPAGAIDFRMITKRTPSWGWTFWATFDDRREEVGIGIDVTPPQGRPDLHAQFGARLDPWDPTATHRTYEIEMRCDGSIGRYPLDSSNPIEVKSIPEEHAGFCL